MYNSRHLIQALVDTCPLACAVFDENLDIVEVNQATLTLHQFTNKSIYIDGFYEICPEIQPCGTLSREKFPNELRRGFKDGKNSLVWYYKSLDGGEPFPVELTMELVSIDGQKALVTYGRDIREQGEIESLRSMNQKTLQAMLDSAPNLCAVFDEDCNVLDVNRKVLSLLGIPDKSVFLNSFFDCCMEFQPCGTPTREKAVELLQLVFEKGELHFIWEYKHANGKAVPTDIHFKAVELGGKRLAIVHARDLRYERDMIKKLEDAMKQSLIVEAAEESNRAKSKFLARMSHEIRTPITAVLGISEIRLQDRNLEPKIEESFAKIHNSSNLLLGIINDALDLSKIEAGKMELLPEKYELANLISNSAHLYITYLGDKDIKFSLNVSENLPAFLIGDSIRIEQIINNLLSNAFKYTEAGEVNLSFDVGEHKLDNYVTLLVSIRDTGVGMTKQQLGIIYNEYERFYEKNTHIISGIGLGMPIVYNLIQLMDAEIEIESEVGVGTTVSVLIPHEKSTCEVIGKETALDLQQFDSYVKNAAKRFSIMTESMPYGRVLVVDDVQANLYVAQGLLQFYDLNIETCESGFEALEKIKSGEVYDIVFMDHMMPEMNGVETLHKMRKLGYAEPVIALTANAMIGKAEEFIKEGFDGFISKPVQTKYLHTALIKFIKDKQPHEVILAAEKNSTSKKNIDEFQNNKELLEKISKDFAKNQKNVYREIMDAMGKNDNETAMRLAHTVKGLAGLMHESQLAKAAATVEYTIDAGKKPTNEELSLFENEMAKVLNSIDFVEDTNEKAKEQLQQLKSMLESRKSQSAEMLDDLRKIPEAAILVKQVEKFKFKDALVSLGILSELL